MREWPSIVPGAPEEYYIVINHYREVGSAFAETDLDRWRWPVSGHCNLGQWDDSR
jgi:hypothetical protein